MRALCACAFLCILLLGSSASAVILFSLPDTASCRDDTLCVPMMVDGVSGENIIAFACSLTYDETIIHCVSPYFDASGGIASSWTIYDTVNNVDGWLKIGGFSESPLLGTGQLLCLYFWVLPGAAGGSSSDIIFSYCELNEDISPNTIDGQITVLYPTLGQVTGVIASGDLCDRVTLSWTPVAHATGYQIARDDILIASTDSGVTEYSDLAASVGTHQYKVRAVNACTEGPYSDPVSGTRLAIPAAPSPVVASDTSCAGVWVTWQDVAGETSYQVNRAGVPIALSLPANTTSFQDTTAVAGMTYQYMVFAINVCGNAASSDLGRRLPLPGQPTCVAASDSGCTQVIVEWCMLDDVDSFQIRRDGTRIGSVGAGTTSFSDITASPGYCYAYTVVAYNKCGVSNVSLPDSGCCFRVPEIPTGLIATTDRCDSVILNWNAAARAVQYQVIRSPGGEACLVPAGVTRCADAPPPGTYTYHVQAWNTCGWGNPSNTVDGTRLDVPAQVTGVGATLNRCDSIVVWWSDLPNETAYHIYRNGASIATLPANQTHFAEAPTPGSYLYSVRGENQCGAGPLSAEVNASRLSAPSQPVDVSASDTSCFYVCVSWTAVGSAADSFQICRDGSRVGVAAGIASSYCDLTALPGVTYAYDVVPYNSCGAGPASLPDNGFRLPAPAQVAGVTATDNRCDSVIVTWTDLPNETYYRVYRSGEAVGSPSADQTRFADAPPSGEHSYQVLGGNDCGDGPVSESVNGVRLASAGTPTGVAATDNLCG